MMSTFSPVEMKWETLEVEDCTRIERISAAYCLFCDTAGSLAWMRRRSQGRNEVDWRREEAIAGRKERVSRTERIW